MILGLIAFLGFGAICAYLAYSLDKLERRVRDLEGGESGRFYDEDGKVKLGLGGKEA